MLEYPEERKVLKSENGVRLERVVRSFKYRCTHGKYSGRHVIKTCIDYEVWDDNAGKARTYELKRNALKYYNERIAL